MQIELTVCRSQTPLEIVISTSGVECGKEPGLFSETGTGELVVCQSLVFYYYYYYYHHEGEESRMTGTTREP
jgi:hypothetical protein